MKRHTKGDRGFTRRSRGKSNLLIKRCLLERIQAIAMENRPTSKPRPFVFLDQQGVLIHVGYALFVAVSVTVASRPPSLYVGLRAFLTLYVWLLLSTLICVHCSRKWFWIWMGAEFFFVNQWFTWLLLEQFGNVPDVLAAFIVKLTWGWIAAMVLGRVLLPMPGGAGGEIFSQ
jgi:hypothetical protein